MLRIRAVSYCSLVGNIAPIYYMQSLVPHKNQYRDWGHVGEAFEGLNPKPRSRKREVPWKIRPVQGNNVAF